MSNSKEKSGLDKNVINWLITVYSNYYNNLKMDEIVINFAFFML